MTGMRSICVKDSLFWTDGTDRQAYTSEVGSIGVRIRQKENHPGISVLKEWAGPIDSLIYSVIQIKDKLLFYYGQEYGTSFVSFLLALKGSKNFVLIDVTNAQPALCGFRINRKLFLQEFFSVNFFRKMSTFSGKSGFWENTLSTFSEKKPKSVNQNQEKTGWIGPKMNCNAATLQRYVQRYR